MIREDPDRSLDLESEMQNFHQEIYSFKKWYFRERYIDRCILDPFYILEFNIEVDDEGDDLYDQELFETPYPCLRGVCLTREAQGPGGSYWRHMKKEDLIRRLDRFMAMYRENYLQPPGYRGDIITPQYVHDRLDKKRFLFEIRSPRKGIIGIGPKMFAGVADIGAICGQVTDENGDPLNGVTIELVAKEETLTQQTESGGLFWFSKVPEGNCLIRVRERRCVVQILRQEEFGNISGWLSDQDGKPVANSLVSFRAPAGEIFNAMTDPTGKFSTAPLPAYPVQDSPLSKYPYIMIIPDFMFSIHKSVIVRDAVIGGILKNERGIALQGKTVILKKGSEEMAKTITSLRGEFQFFGIGGGRYQIEVPDSKIYAKEISGSRITGKVSDTSESVELELVAKDAVTRTERTCMEGEFYFENIAPGNYVARLKNITRG